VGTYMAKLLFLKRNGEPQTFSDIRFQMYPRGTLAQKGELASFATNKTEYLKGETARMTGEFRNTGKIGVLATLGIEIMQNDKRVDVLSSDSVFVPVGGSYVFSKNYVPLLPGSFVAIGSMTYGANRTEEVRASFTVKTAIPTPYVLISLSLLTILLAVILWLLVRRRRRVPPSPTPPQK